MQLATGPVYRATKPIRDEARRRFCKRYPCIGCGQTWGIDAMHSGSHGLGQKSCDTTTLPGCRKCHDAFDADPRGFAREHGLNIRSEVRKMNALYKKHVGKAA